MSNSEPPISSSALSGKKYSATVLITAAISIQLVASGAFPMAKFGLAIIEPYTFAFYRYLISSAVLLALAYFQKSRVPIERADWPKIFLLGVLIIPLNQTAFLVGQSMTGAGHGAVMFAITPVALLILAVVHLKEKLTIRRGIGSAIAFAGVMVIMLSGALDISIDYLIGDAIILVAVLAWAYYSIIGKLLVRKYGALQLTAYAMASGTILYLPFGAYRAWIFDYSEVTLAAWGTVLYLALGLSITVYVLWYWLLKQMDASRAAVYHNIQPVVATLLAWMFLGEQVTTAFLVGGVVVLIGVITSETG